MNKLGRRYSDESVVWIAIYGILGQRSVSEGVFVGVAMVNLLERLKSESAIEISSQVSKLLGDMRTAMDRA